ncbi:MAG: arabinosyltransferase domain-containing protein [Gordonia sp. (in: high G+C Gram-positive bacteria)]|uniref:arabinosyltransferase domain-containing protein n=1 Tax=Gordonia sp. (in: high G+C Gram-positive bacteria) TaxID=84139 RepID=UPI0039E305CE
MSTTAPEATERSARSAPLSAPQARLLAAIGGLVAIVAALAVPFLPVQVTEATITWPQGQQLNDDDPSVVAPLIAQVPQRLDITVPCAALERAASKNGVLLATMPPDAPRLAGSALVINTRDERVTVLFRSNVAATATHAELASDRCRNLRVFVSPSQVGAQFVGLGPATVLPSDKRPQIDGVFTALSTDQVAALETAGMRSTIVVDNRYESSATLLKTVVMVIAVLAALVALFALYCLDLIRGHRGPPALRLADRIRALRPRATDAAVTLVLVVWLFVGAGAPDDGYIINMGRTADAAGYLSNYYRYFGIAEAPFDWYYAFLAFWGSISSSLVWLHLPAMIAGLLSWFLLSRVVLPRLGRAVKPTGWTGWAAASVFLVFWMPFCSGLRTEGIIVLGSLLTWWAAEKAIATKQLFPAALAATTAAFTVALAPQGAISLAILLVCARALLRVLVERRREDSLLSLLAPIGAAALVVLVVVFRDQTLMTVLEALKIRYQTGPIIPWSQEFLRYYFVSVTTPDGAIARRVPLLLLFSGAIVTAAVLLRRGGVDGVERGPAWRLVGAFAVTLLLFFFVPVKWTVHFGVFAGLAAALAATGTLAVAESAARSSRNLTVFVAGLLFGLAAVASGFNSWPIVYRYNISWFDQAPSFAGQQVSSGLLVLAVIAVAMALWQTLRLDYVDNRGMAHHGAGEADSKADRRRMAMASSPITVIAALMVLATLGLYAKAVVTRAPAMTAFSHNVDTLSSSSCGMADQVLVESDPNAGLLTPADGRSQSATLAGEGGIGFTPDGVAQDLRPPTVTSRPGRMHVGGSTSKPFATNGTLGTGTTGGTGPKTVNGSTVALPFGLDPATTPVLGSYGYQGNAHLETGWYRLPARDASPILVFATAGAIASVDVNGVDMPGQSLKVQFGRSGANGEFVPAGPLVTPIDPGPQIANQPWRNLRVPMSAAPGGATVVRLVLDDTNLGPQQFIGITPPRAPRLQTLQEAVGSADPALIDFPIAAFFPCQRPMAFRHGVMEVPKWRILPDFVTLNMQSKTWMAASGGGLLAVSQATTEATVVPTYLKDDWHQDWGTLKKLAPLAPDAATARVTTRQVTQSGLSRAGSIRVEAPKND